jgi:aminoglycoside phosphotransferase (APT) family kinase protein
LARVVSITRQARWRAAWLVEAERDAMLLPLVVRGERGADIPMQFPLHHEMAFQNTLAEQGIPVPPVYGWIEELPAYVMARVDGQPGFDGLAIEQRDAVMHDYMATLARLHRLPLQPFVDAGVERAATPAGSGLYGIERFETVWRAGKSAPNPLLEFMLGWMKRNPVDTRGRESTIVWDSGQMHQQDGRLIALLDVEIGHIGDPMMDLAAPRMRDTVLHFGDFANLYAEYERAGGFPVDIDAVQLHHIAFTLTNEMAFRNSLNDPVPDLDRRQIRDKARPPWGHPAPPWPRTTPASRSNRLAEYRAVRRLSQALAPAPKCSLPSKCLFMLVSASYSAVLSD